jgi:hypothetical protein
MPEIMRIRNDARVADRVTRAAVADISRSSGSAIDPARTLGARQEAPVDATGVNVG